MKKILYSLLAMTIAISSMPLSAWASEDSLTLEDRQDINTVVKDSIATFSENRMVDQFIVKFKEDSIFSSQTLNIDEDHHAEGTINIINQDSEYTVIKLEEKVDADVFMTELADSVEFIQPDYELEISAFEEVTQNSNGSFTEIPSTVFNYTENLATTHLLSTGAGITIAVIDTGIDVTHPDLTDHLIDGWDFVNDCNNVSISGAAWAEIHGTHIAGIIAEVAPEAKIMPLKAFEYGKAYTSDIVKAIQYAENHGASIINCSWGSSADNPILKKTIESSSMLFIAAAGNNRQCLEDYPVYPASYPFENVISVASINNDGGMSYFSNYGASIDIAAWGRDVLSTVPGGEYSISQGTSVSAAYISGAAALVNGETFDASMVKELLLRSADKADILSQKVKEGSIVNFFNAASGIDGKQIIVDEVIDDFDVLAERTEGWNLLSTTGNKAVCVSSGLDHCAIVKEDGTVWTWGTNDYEQLGYPLYTTSQISFFPQQVPGITDAKYVYAGYRYTMIVKEDGTVWAWGQNMAGQFGNGAVSQKVSTPIKSSITNVKQIAGNGTSVLFLKENGTVWFAGADQGLLGKGSGNGTYYRTPVQVSGLSGITKIDAGLADAAALDRTGNVYLWGKPNSNSSQPIVPTIHLTGAQDIACGTNTMVALKNNAVYGYGSAGKTYSNPISLLQSEEEKTIKSLTAGDGYVLVVYTDGTVKGFGRNDLSQLGDGTLSNTSYEFWQPVVTDTDPRFQTNFSGVSYVSTYESANVALMKNGTVYTWGGNLYGQIESPQWTSPSQYQANCPSQVSGFGPDEIKQSPKAYLYGPIDLSQETVAQILPARPSILLVNGKRASIPVQWDVSTFSKASYSYGDVATVYGTFDLTNTSITNPYRYRCCASIDLITNSAVQSVKALPTTYLQYGTKVNDIQLPTSINVTFSDPSLSFKKFTLSTNVQWDLSTSTYDSTNYSSIQTITGTLQLPTKGYSNPQKVVAEAKIQVQISIEEIPELEKIVPYGTSASDLGLPEKVKVILTDNKEADIPVTWTTKPYDPYLTNTPQILIGALELPDGISNPNNLSASVKVIIQDVSRYPITEIKPRHQTVMQNYPFEPFDKEHYNDWGDPASTQELVYQDAVVLFDEREQEILPVKWDFEHSDYDYTTAGTYTVWGEVQFDEDSGISNPNNLKAKYEIEVIPTEYNVWDYEPVKIDVLLGTPLSELNSILVSEGKNEIGVCAESEDENGVQDSYLFCEIIIIDDKDTTDYNMDKPGTYTVLAQMPDNFINGTNNMIEIEVKVLDPSPITKAEARMTAYQSVAPKYMTDIPSQALLTLENGKTILSDVKWDFDNYDTDSSQDHIVYGTLQNIPAAAVQPTARSVLVTLIVNTVEARYEVSEVTGASYTAGTCLTLEELKSILDPTLVLTLESQGEETVREIQYELPLTLEEGESGFDPQKAGQYTFEAPFTLSDNITWPAGLSKQVMITTEKVEIIGVQTVSVPVSEGTSFGAVPLPNQVIATVSCKGADGENKNILIDVLWEEPDNYTANPEVWGEDGTVTFAVQGTLPEDSTNYISNAAETVIHANITMIPAPTLVSITPSLFPVGDILSVPVGTTLDEICAELENPQAELTLEDYNGNVYTLQASFMLRAEENPHYDPTDPEAKEYTLNAYLLLDNAIKNPDGLGVRVKIQTKKYSITGFESITRTYEVGTSFTDLNLPNEVMTRWGDSQAELLQVSWSEDRYNSQKIGIQQIPGTLATPLPLHLENTKNRQPRARITLVEPNTQLMSLTPADMGQIPMTLAAEFDDWDDIPGYTEYFFWAEYLHEDGHTSMELISILVEDNNS